VIGWAAVVKDLDSGNVIILGTSSNESSVGVVAISVFSRVTSEVTVLIDNGTAVITTVDLNGRGIIVSGTGSNELIVWVFAYWVVSGPSLEVTVLVKGGLTTLWLWSDVIGWATIIENLDCGHIIILSTSSDEISISMITSSVFSIVTTEVTVLIDNGTTVITTIDLDGTSIIVSGTSGNEIVVWVLANSVVSGPSLEVTMLVKGSLTSLWFWSRLLRWTSTGDNFDR